MEYVTYGSFFFLAGIVSAKWALDLGFSQVRQIIWGLGGLCLGPLILLILYIQLVRRPQAT